SRSAAMKDLVGRQIGQYEITRVLGQGAMAVVYEARDPLLQRMVAVKVIRANLVGGADFLQRFQLQARVVARLSHPDILSIYQFYESEGLVFFVTPLVTGGTLAQRLGQGPLAPRDVERIARELASALDYAHGCGVVHRDLKPSNVLLDASGN